MPHSVKCHIDSKVCLIFDEDMILSSMKSYFAVKTASPILCVLDSWPDYASQLTFEFAVYNKNMAVSPVVESYIHSNCQNPKDSVFSQHPEKGAADNLKQNRFNFEFSQFAKQLFGYSLDSNSNFDCNNSIFVRVIYNDVPQFIKNCSIGNNETVEAEYWCPYLNFFSILDEHSMTYDEYSESCKEDKPIL